MARIAGIDELVPLNYLGDSENSVDDIDRGLYWRLREAGHY